MKLTLCMIVKNEQSVLESCLESLKGVYDEIVIVDTGSTDNTVKIAQKYAGKVHHFKWVDDFSAARNYALTLCKTDYILTWDADWILRAGDKDKILALKKVLNNYDSVYFAWNVEFNEQQEVIRQSRYHFIFNRNQYYWRSPIHNELVYKGTKPERSLLRMNIEVFHHKDPTVKGHRYEQTRSIIEKELENHPNNTRLRIFYAQGMQFDGLFDEAINQYQKCLENTTLNQTSKINITERIGQCYHSMKQYKEGALYLQSSKYVSEPRIQLMLADLYLPINPIKAFVIYKTYAQQPALPYADEFDYYPERYQVYPYITLAKLYSLILRGKKAKQYYQIALTNTHVAATKSMLAAKV